LDAALVQAATEAGASFLCETWAALGSVCADYRQLKLRQAKDQRSLRARLVLAADGLSGGLLGRQTELENNVARKSRLGAGTMVERVLDNYREGTIYMACGSAGYVGVVRVEKNRMAIAAALDPSSVKQSGTLGAAAEQILGRAGMPAIAGVGTAHWLGTPHLTRQTSHLSLERTLLLGDAAGYVEPFTGQGIAWAIDSAAQLAPLAHRAIRRWHSDVGTEWTRTFGKAMKRRQFYCRWLSRALRHPSLVGMLVSSLSTSPWLAAPLVRRIHSS
jgi:flavin-dependent dehydrogenase